MSATYFVDTNIFVYARDLSEPEKQLRALRWLKWLWAEEQGRISYQVLQEYYITVTRKLDPGMPVRAAREDVRALLVWRPVVIDAVVFDNAWAAQDRYRISWWDALIVAAAQVASCGFLLSEDLQADQLLGDVRIVNPFSKEPGKG